MSIFEQYIETFAGQDAREMEIAEIAERMAAAHGTKRSSILPSDYSYNVWNLPERRRRYLFERIDDAKYRYLGPNYPYSGPMVRHALGSEQEEVVGTWTNGQLTLRRPRVWFTTHWPPRVGDHAPPSGLIVQEGKEDVLRDAAPGDLVWIYESADGKTALRTSADGSVLKVRCEPGRQGVIALCRVTSKALAQDDVQPEAYVDGSVKHWKWRAETEVLNSSGFVSREDALRCLGYKPAYNFRGFGEQSSGAKQITEQEHDALLAAFNAQSAITHEEMLGRAAAAAMRSPRGPGGEGPLHLQIKQMIAADPSACLQEEGLTHLHTEYPYGTGDRVDLVLRDQYGRYVTVEVEPTCDATEINGPLQCLKYRAMLAYLLKVPVDEVRTMLVAPDIHADVRARCERYGVELRTFGG